MEIQNNSELLDKDSYPELSQIIQYIQENGVFENIISLGHNWDRTEKWPAHLESKLELSIPSRITALTSYLLLELGLSKRIIFSGGKTAGIQHLSEARAMLYYLEDLFGNKKIDAKKDKIILEEKSHTTYSNLHETGEVLKKSTPAVIKNIGLMSIGYHMDIRAESISNANNMPIDLFIHSDNLLYDLMKYIENDSDLSTRIFGEPADITYVRRISLISNLIQNYKTYLNSPIYIDKQKQLKLNAHGPLYHNLAKIFQIITLDNTGKKTDKKASGRLKSGNI